jgi:hypothetical protein
MTNMHGMRLHVLADLHGEFGPVDIPDFDPAMVIEVSSASE